MKRATRLSLANPQLLMSEIAFVLLGMMRTCQVDVDSARNRTGRIHLPARKEKADHFRSMSPRGSLAHLVIKSHLKNEPATSKMTIHGLLLNFPVDRGLS
jgi:hypothetical protein